MKGDGVAAELSRGRFGSDDGRFFRNVVGVMNGILPSPWHFQEISVKT